MALPNKIKFKKFTDDLVNDLVGQEQAAPTPEQMAQAFVKTLGTPSPQIKSHSDILAQELTAASNPSAWPHVCANCGQEKSLHHSTTKSCPKSTMSDPNGTGKVLVTSWNTTTFSEAASPLPKVEPLEVGEQVKKASVEDIPFLDPIALCTAMTHEQLQYVMSNYGLVKLSTIKQAKDLNAEELKQQVKHDLLREIAFQLGFVPKAEVKIADAPQGELRHKQFNSLVRWLTSRTESGIFQPVWLWGGPGGGKSTLAEQMAPSLREFALEHRKELGTDSLLPIPEESDWFYPVACSDTMSKGDAIGYTSAAHGTYIPGFARHWFEHGGFLYLDEIDNSTTGLMVTLNALKANKFFRFPDGKLIKRHPYTFLMAGANTLGTGSQNGFQRKAQDAASRDRYAKVHFEYDERLERLLAKHDKWVDYVQKVRKHVSTLAKCSVWITPRASYGGASALRNGVPPEQVVYAFIYSEFSKDLQISIKNACGEFKG